MDSTGRPAARRVQARHPSPLIGRDNELRFLTSCLGRAANGDGGVVLISGEAGIGKTRLLHELSEAARTAGWLVLTGRAYDTEGMPPYLPFGEAISQYLREVGGEER